MYLYDFGRFGFAAGCLLATLRYGLAIKPARLPDSQPNANSTSTTAPVLLVLVGYSLTGVPSKIVNLLIGTNSTSKSQDTDTSKTAHVLLVLVGYSLTGVPSRIVNLLTGMNSTSKRQDKDSPVTPQNGRDR
jgi:hypothetical protein